MNFLLHHLKLAKADRKRDQLVAKESTEPLCIYYTAVWLCVHRGMLGRSVNAG